MSVKKLTSERIQTVLVMCCICSSFLAALPLDTGQGRRYNAGNIDKAMEFAATASCRHRLR